MIYYRAPGGVRLLGGIVLTEELPIFSTKGFRLRITIATQMVSFTVAAGISQIIAITPLFYIAGADIRIFQGLFEMIVNNQYTLD